MSAAAAAAAAAAVSEVLSVRRVEAAAVCGEGSVVCRLRDGQRCLCSVEPGSAPDERPLLLLRKASVPHTTVQAVPLPFACGSSVAVHALVPHRALLVVEDGRALHTLGAALEPLRPVVLRHWQRAGGCVVPYCVGVAWARALRQPLVLLYDNTAQQHYLAPIMRTTGAQSTNELTQDSWADTIAGADAAGAAGPEFFIDGRAAVAVGGGGAPCSSVVAADAIAEGPEAVTVGLYTQPERRLLLVRVSSAATSAAPLGCTVLGSVTSELAPVVFTQRLSGTMAVDVMAVATRSGLVGALVGARCVAQVDVLAGHAPRGSRLVGLRAMCLGREEQAEQAVFGAVVAAGDNRSDAVQHLECAVQVVPTNEVACELLESLARVPSRSMAWHSIVADVLERFALERQLQQHQQHQQQTGDWAAFAAALWHSAFGEVQHDQHNHSDVAPSAAAVGADDGDDDEAWRALMASDEHAAAMCEDAAVQSLGVAPTKPLFAQRVRSVKWQPKYVLELSEELHLCYESSKMNTLRAPLLLGLASLSLRVAAPLQRHSLVEYYAREWPALMSTPSFADWHRHSRAGEAAASAPAAFFVDNWLLAALHRLGTTTTSETARAQQLSVPECIEARHRCRLPNVARLWTLCSAYCALNNQPVTDVPPERVVQQTVDALVACGVTQELLDTLPMGVALHLREACQNAAAVPSPAWPAHVLRLVGRPDAALQREQSRELAAHERQRLQHALFHHHNRTNTTTSGGVGSASAGTLDEEEPKDAPAILAQYAAAGATGRSKRGAKAASAEAAAAAAGDGTECANTLVDMRFPDDQRVDEIRGLLSWSKRVTVPIEETEGVEWAARQQAFLRRASNQTLALPLGRGAFALSLDRVEGCNRPATKDHHQQPTHSSVEDGDEAEVVEEAEEYPRLVLDGHTTTGHDVCWDAKPPEQLLSWPMFHNGAACGLRLPAGAALDSGSDAWRVLSKHKHAARAANAGFLLGAGLQGHLPRAPTARVLELLCAQNELVSVAVLLALGAANAGSGSEAVARTLFMHAPHLRSEHASAAHTTGLSREAAAAAACTAEQHPAVVEAALVGLGLLYRGTGQQSVAEALLHELAVQPALRTGPNWRSYALSAGYALGLACLGCGDSVRLAGGGKLADALEPLVVGGPESDEQRRARRVDTGFAAQSQQPVLVATHGWVSPAITAPGAAVALGLAYFGTCSAAATRALHVPATRADLEHVCCEHVQLRVLARCLVNWPAIAPTADWFQQQLPPCVLEELDHQQGVLRGPCDDPLLAEAYWAAATGAALALGLRGAGSHMRRARDLLLRLWSALQEQLWASPAMRAQQHVYEDHVDALGTALALVMAGSGDLETTRVLRCAHLRVASLSSAAAGAGVAGDEGLYGHAMARAQALGLLYLGGGLLTLDHSKEAAAALLGAVYPVWPRSPDDNSHHLQALRHLYACAATCRLVVACDVQAMRPERVAVGVRRTNRPAETVHQTPFTIPYSDSDVCELVVRSHTHMPHCLQRSIPPAPVEEGGAWLVRAGASERSCPLVLFVQRRRGEHSGGGALFDEVAQSPRMLLRQLAHAMRRSGEQAGLAGAQQALVLLADLAAQHSGSEDEQEREHGLDDEDLADGDEGRAALSRLVATALLQAQQTQQHGADSQLLAVRVLAALWAVTKSVSCASPVLRQCSRAVADVARLLCCPSRAVPAAVAAEARAELRPCIRAAAPLVRAFVCRGELPRTLAEQQQLAAVLALLGVPQRDKLERLRKALATTSTTAKSPATVAAAVLEAMPDAAPDTVACVVELLLLPGSP